MRTAPSLCIHHLGSFKVQRSDSNTAIAFRRKTRAVLAYVAATGRPLPRQELVDMFCQEVNDPRGALRSILRRIRQRLGSDVLLTEGDTVQFNQTVGWVACLEFARILDADLAPLSLEVLTTTIDLYRGEFLHNVNLGSSPEFELWLLNERTRYQRLYERGLEALVTRLTAQGDITSAIVRAQELVHSSPLTEEAHARLMWLYARSGQREAAVEQYEQCRTLLQRELAVEPTPELRALRDEIAAGHLGRSPPLPAAAIELPSRTQKAGDFVGRAGEMAQLRGAWKVSRPGHIPVVLVDAEAGMGKTRLVREFAHTIPEADFLVGECFESTRALAYAPWLDVLEARLERLDDAVLEQLSPFAVEYLTRLIPTLARRRKQRPPPILSTGDGELSRLFTAVSEFLLELPETPPLLLFLDNLQWADEASLQLFHFLARRAAPGKVLLIGALRTEEVGDTSALQSLLGDLQHHSFFHLQLPPLTPRAITQLTAQLWASLPEGYRPHVSNMLARATGGNPLFVSEILRELSHTTDVPSALPVPKSVSDLIQRRLNRLSESSRQVVEAMAVLDSPATPAQAQQASGRSEEEIVTAIDVALRRGFLHPLTEADSVRYGFSHDLMREAVIGQISHVRRQLLHRRVAITLERTDAPAATLAHHWQMAGDLEKEAHYTALAGEQAAAIFANDEAVRYLERALELTTTPERRLHIMGELGDVYVLTGEWGEAKAIFTRALALAEEYGNRQQQAQFQAALGKLTSRRGLFGQALAWLEKARDNYEDLGDRSGVAGCVGTMGIVYWQQDDYDQALVCYQRALDIETDLNNEPGIAIWTGNIGAIYNQRGEYGAARDYYERSLRLRRKLGMKLEVGIETGNLGNLYYSMGDYRKATTYHREALEIRQELGDKAGIATVLGNLGRDYAMLGDDQSALACFQTALQYNLELCNWEGIALQLGRIGQGLASRGDYQQALAWCDRSIDVFRRLGSPYYLSKQLTAKARVLFSLGDYASAQPLNDEALEIAREVDRDVEFSARLLAIRLKVARRRLKKRQAKETLLALLDEFDRPEQRAALLYEIWRLHPNALSARQRTNVITVYRHLYCETYHLTYRRRYEQLTEEPLPDPPALPELPEVKTAEPIALSVQLARVGQVLTDFLEQVST